jgi:cation:H+ antiporter
MTQAVVEFLLLAAVIIVAGTVLARCADAVAEITGFGRLLIGSVLLAGATSLPELTVDLSAIRLNLPDLAVGDLLGSSLMNLLILAMLDLTYTSRGKMLSRAAAAHALSGLLSIALTAAVGVGLLTAGRAPDLGFLGVHASIWLVAGGYVLGVRLVFLDQRVALQEAAAAGAATEELQPRGKLSRYVGGFIAAAVVIVLAGPRLAEAAGKIAELSGLGSSFVGTTFVALSTSLPELVASLAALRIGAFDLAVGNVFGSNAFNMLLFVPLDVAFPGTLLAAANPAHLVSVLAVVVASAVAIMGQLYRSERRVPLLEPDAWLVIVLIFVALVLVYLTSGPAA